MSDVRQVWVIAAAHAALNAFLDWQDLTPWGLTAEQMLLLVARHIAHSVLLLYMYFFVHRVINRCEQVRACPRGADGRVLTVAHP